MSKPNIVGQLVVVAYKARYLPEREIVGKQDPFVVFRIGETVERTKTDIRGGQHPVWDDQVTLPIPEKKTTVVCQVYDEDGKRQELISECDLDISNVLKEGEEDNWYPLKYKGREAGEIYLEMTFYAARPPPKRQPTRFGMSKPFKPQGGYVPTVPHQPTTQQHQQVRPYPPANTSQYPSQQISRPPPNVVESHSTPTYNPQKQQQQQHPPYNYGGATTPRPYPPANPTASVSTTSNSSHTSYPPTNNNNKPVNYGIQPPLNTNRPTSPPVPRPTNNFNDHTHNAPLLSSSYNPTNNKPQPNYNQGYPPTNPGYPPSNNNSGYPPSNNNSGYPPSNNNSGYPPSNNNSGYPPNNNNNNGRNSYQGFNNNSPYPSQQFNGGFPEPQHFPSGFMPHADNLGTPFAAHQGAFQNPQGYPPTSGYPPQPQGYPPSNNNYPPY